MHDGKGEKIRLYGIDTPEKKQAFGKKAKKFTSDIGAGKMVEVKPVTTDRFGRTVGLVYIDGKCLSEELVMAGYAWVYKRYCGKAICVKWIDIEQKVKAGRVGLWAAPNPVAPWQFRRSKKK